MSYIAPSQFLRNAKIQVTAGMILDPIELGMEPHPVFGDLPVVTVIEAKEDGSVFLLGEIECDCGNLRTIHPGDWFQVRACETCTKKRQRKARRHTKSDEEKAAAQATRELKQAQDAITRAEEKAKVAQARAAKLQEELEARQALVAKVAQEKGVGVSKS
jgi:hypothetical protein